MQRSVSVKGIADEEIGFTPLLSRIRMRRNIDPIWLVILI